jgi:hypothetical protein
MSNRFGSGIFSTIDGYGGVYCRARIRATRWLRPILHGGPPIRDVRCVAAAIP